MLILNGAIDLHTSCRLHVVCCVCLVVCFTLCQGFLISSWAPITAPASGIFKMGSRVSPADMLGFMTMMKQELVQSGEMSEDFDVGCVSVPGIAEHDVKPECAEDDVKPPVPSSPETEVKPPVAPSPADDV